MFGSERLDCAAKGTIKTGGEAGENEPIIDGNMDVKM